MLGKVRGALFFGVPSYSMDIPDLMAMIGTQPNRVLLEELSDKSDDNYLSFLDKQFDGISEVWNLGCHWAYETRETPTVEVSALTVLP